MNSVSEALGQSYDVELPGISRSYKLGVLTLQDLADFCVWCESLPLRKLKAVESLISPEEFAKQMQIAVEDVLLSSIEPLSQKFFQIIAERSGTAMPYLFWKSASKFTEMTLDQFRQDVPLAAMRTMYDMLKTITGLDALQNANPTLPTTPIMTGTDSSSDSPANHPTGDQSASAA